MVLVTRFLTIPRLILAAVVVALGLGFVAGTVLTAQGAPENSTVYACVNRYNGDMRMPRVEGQCASTEFAVSWESYDAGSLDDEYVNEGQADSITSDMIVDGEVNTSDLADDSVTSAKIEDGQVMTADIADQAITLDKMADDSVGRAQIFDGAVGTDQLTGESVTSDKILDGTITANDLGSDSVDSDEIAGEAVTTDEIADGTIASDDLDSTLYDEATTIQGRNVLESTQSTIPASVALETSLICPTGSVAISGGVTSSVNFGGYVVDSFPDPSDPARWTATYFNDTSGDVVVTFYSVCVAG